MLEINPHNNYEAIIAAMFNNVFDKAMQFSQSECGYMHSLKFELNDLLCQTLFFI